MDSRKRDRSGCFGAEDHEGEKKMADADGRRALSTGRGVNFQTQADNTGDAGATDSGRFQSQPPGFLKDDK